MVLSMAANSPIPLLLISDSPSGPTGLGRICRDLATRIHENLSDIYRLATAGTGSPGSIKFPWMQYNFEATPEWVMPSLPDIVEDFAGKERCRVMFIGDLHRVSWFSQPERLGNESLAKFPVLKSWLLKANIDRWCYVPIDSSGPQDKFSFPIALTAMGFDRLLAYGKFGEGVLRRTMGDAEADKRHLTWLPHGINGDAFFSRDYTASRDGFLDYTGAQSMLHLLGVHTKTSPIAADEVLVGVVCSNQGRKDLPLTCETIALLSQQRKTRFWLHTDQLERAWSIPSLLVDYGILENTIISLDVVSDEKLASAYSACDVTLGPGSEGFGFPLMESQFCGCPVVTGAYAGGADIVPEYWQVEPVAYRYEGSYASKRPVYNAEDWVKKVNYLVGRRCNRPGEYDWKRLWPERWEHWFRRGV